MGDALVEVTMAMDGAVGQAARSVEATGEQVELPELKIPLRDGIGGMKQASAENKQGGDFGMVVLHADRCC